MSEGDTSSTELQASLTRLHSTLISSSAVDEPSRQLLREVLGDIERLLKTPADTAKANPPSPRLELLAASFDAGHPTLSASVRELIDLLGRAGL